MAIYSYKCLSCDNIFNLRATIKEKEEAKDEKFTCPKCQSKNIKYNFSLANFFKNIFNSDNNSSNCCSGKNSSDCGCESVKEGDNCCSDKDNKDSCCS